MSAQFAYLEYPKDIECCICLEPWVDPVEIAPCKHVFCRRCIERLRECPECRHRITGHVAPNRILVNLAAEVKQQCKGCGWIGERAQTATHRCSTENRRSTPPPQHQQQQWQGRPAIIRAGNSDRPWEKYDLEMEEYDHVFSIFINFDTDDSGELSRRELTTLARWLNFAHTQADIDNLFLQMDTDHSGALSMDEFCTWLKYNKPNPDALYGMSQSDYNYVLMQFHSFDRNHDGELNMMEFTNLCLNNLFCRTPEEAQGLFRDIDLSRSGKVNLHEFLTFRASMNRR